MNKKSKSEPEIYPLNAGAHGKDTLWAFGVSKKKLDKCDYLLLCCDFDTINKKYFKIPYEYLKSNILNNPQINSLNGKRYCFEIKKKEPYEFNWHYKVKMKGSPFFYANDFNGLPAKSLCAKTIHHDNSAKKMDLLEKRIFRLEKVIAKSCQSVLDFIGK